MSTGASGAALFVVWRTRWGKSKKANTKQYWGNECRRWLRCLDGNWFSDHDWAISCSSIYSGFILEWLRESAASDMEYSYNSTKTHRDFLDIGCMLVFMSFMPLATNCVGHNSFCGYRTNVFWVRVTVKIKYQAVKRNGRSRVEERSWHIRDSPWKRSHNILGGLQSWFSLYHKGTIYYKVISHVLTWIIAEDTSYLHYCKSWGV